MKPKSLSQAKNAMRRALADLVDPPASADEQNELRAFFDNCCAYCGAAAPPRSGHLDHAEPGAGNSAGNLLLACSTCNGDEKRERAWLEFLHEKCGRDAAVLSARRSRIEKWQGLHPIEVRQYSQEVHEARKAAEAAIEEFSLPFAQLRDVLRRTRSPSQ